MNIIFSNVTDIKVLMISRSSLFKNINFENYW